MTTVAGRSMWVAVLVLCLVAVAAPVASAASIPEGEPNDNYWEPTEIESGVPVSGTVHGTYNSYTGWYDQDYFAIYASDGAEIVVEVDRSGGTGVFYVAIGTPDNVPLTEFRPVRAGGSDTARTVAPGTGWYLVYVTGYTGYEPAPGTGSYVLTAHTGSEATPVSEPPAPTETSGQGLAEVLERNDRPTPEPTPDETPSPTATVVPTHTPGAPLGSSTPPDSGTPWLFAASLVGFLAGFLTANAESEGIKKQSIELFAGALGAPALISLLPDAPSIVWLVVVGVIGIMAGLVAGTLARNAGLTFAPRV
jgi:hypothetical protein